MNASKTILAPVVVVVGLGYVGLPLAVEFGKKFQTIGTAIDPKAIRNARYCVWRL